MHWLVLICVVVIVYLGIRSYASWEVGGFPQVSFSNPSRYLRIVSGEYYPLAYEIIKRESGWKEKICNQEFGCRSGQGLFQIIPSTIKHCEGVLMRVLDPFYYKDNIDCGIWLLKNEGIGHWQEWSGPY